MRKIFLIPAILAMSTNFAFAIDLSQLVRLNQSIGNTSTGGFARNWASIFQAPIPVNLGRSSNISQSVTINQSIGDTSTGGTAMNNAVVFQGQLPASF